MCVGACRQSCGGGRRARLPQIARTIHQATGGNPLFTIAFLDDLESRRMVRSIGGVSQLFATDDDIRAHRPDTVRQLIDIQIDRSAPNEQHVLEAASAAGVEFTAGAVAHALHIPVDGVASCCETLVIRSVFGFVGGSDGITSDTAFVSGGVVGPHADV